MCEVARSSSSSLAPHIVILLTEVLNIMGDCDERGGSTLKSTLLPLLDYCDLVRWVIPAFCNSSDHRQQFTGCLVYNVNLVSSLHHCHCLIGVAVSPVSHQVIMTVVSECKQCEHSSSLKQVPISSVFFSWSLTTTQWSDWRNNQSLIIKNSKTGRSSARFSLTMTQTGTTIEC